MKFGPKLGLISYVREHFSHTRGGYEHHTTQYHAVSRSITQHYAASRGITRSIKQQHAVSLITHHSSRITHHASRSITQHHAASRSTTQHSCSITQHLYNLSSLPHFFLPSDIPTKGGLRRSQRCVVQEYMDDGMEDH